MSLPTATTFTSFAVEVRPETTTSAVICAGAGMGSAARTGTVGRHRRKSATTPADGGDMGIDLRNAVETLDAMLPRRRDGANEQPRACIWYALAPQCGS